MPALILTEHLTNCDPCESIFYKVTEFVYYIGKNLFMSGRLKWFKP